MFILTISGRYNGTMYAVSSMLVELMCLCPLRMYKGNVTYGLSIILKLPKISNSFWQSTLAYIIGSIGKCLDTVMVLTTESRLTTATNTVNRNAGV